jgi:hypothetical protein
MVALSCITPRCVSLRSTCCFNSSAIPSACRADIVPTCEDGAHGSQARLAEHLTGNQMLQTSTRLTATVLSRAGSARLGSQAGSQDPRRRPTPSDAARMLSLVTDSHRHPSTPRGRLRIRRLGVRIPPSARKNSWSKGIRHSEQGAELLAKAVAGPGTVTPAGALRFVSTSRSSDGGLLGRLTRWTVDI